VKNSKTDNDKAKDMDKAGKIFCISAVFFAIAWLVNISNIMNLILAMIMVCVGYACISEAKKEKAKSDNDPSDEDQKLE